MKNMIDKIVNFLLSFFQRGRRKVYFDLSGKVLNDVFQPIIQEGKHGSE